MNNWEFTKRLNQGGKFLVVDAAIYRKENDLIPVIYAKTEHEIFACTQDRSIVPFIYISMKKDEYNEYLSLKGYKRISTVPLTRAITIQDAFCICREHLKYI